MSAFLTLGLYAGPFLIIGAAVRHWLLRKGVGLSDLGAEGDPTRARPRFLLGFWRNDRPD